MSGVILAAGYSSRMSGFKPLLPIGGRPAVERTVQCFLDAGVDDVRVVVGHRAEEILAVLKSLPVTVLLNPRYDEGMFSSVAAAARSLAETDTEVHYSAFFMLPVDIPLVSPQTLQRVAGSFADSSLVIYPMYEGRRGHPPLISAGLTERILRWDGTGGMRALLRQVEEESPERVIDLPVEDPAVLLDMDTPADYRALLEYWESQERKLCPRRNAYVDESASEHIVQR